MQREEEDNEEIIKYKSPHKLYYQAHKHEHMP